MDAKRAESWGNVWGRQIAQTMKLWPERKAAQAEFVRRTGGVHEVRAFGVFYRAAVVRAASELAAKSQIEMGEGYREEMSHILREALSSAEKEINLVAKLEAMRTTLQKTIRYGFKTLATTTAEKLVIVETDWIAFKAQGGRSRD